MNLIVFFFSFLFLNKIRARGCKYFSFLHRVFLLVSFQGEEIDEEEIVPRLKQTEQESVAVNSTSSITPTVSVFVESNRCVILLVDELIFGIRAILPAFIEILISVLLIRHAIA